MVKYFNLILNILYLKYDSDRDLLICVCVYGTSEQNI